MSCGIHKTFDSGMHRMDYISFPEDNSPWWQGQCPVSGLILDQALEVFQMHPNNPVENDR